MALFPLLLEPERYRACPVDLTQDDAARAYWLALFVNQFRLQLHHAGAGPEVLRSVLAAWEAECSGLSRCSAGHSERHAGGHAGGHPERLDLLELERRAQKILFDHDIRDEFRLIKARENERALKELPGWLDRINQLAPSAALEMIVRGMLAGNLFDLGAPETAEAYAADAPGFAAALDRVPERPWFQDDLDIATARLGSGAFQQPLILVDNAGPDVILGVLPLARWLTDRMGNPAGDDRGTGGTKGAKGSERSGVVTLAANETPSLNDVTAGELRKILDCASD